MNIINILAKKLDQEKDAEKIEYKKKYEHSLILIVRDEIFELMPFTLDNGECKEENIIQKFPEFKYNLKLKKENGINEDKLHFISMKKIA